MKILFTGSEMAPLARTGGLGDVLEALAGSISGAFTTVFLAAAVPLGRWLRIPYPLMALFSLSMIGVGLLPIGRPTCAGVKVLPLAEPKAILTAYAVTRRGRATWPPLRTVLDRMRPAHGSELPRPTWPRPAPGP